MADSLCSIDGCGRPAIARGMCLMHYKRWRRRNPDKIYDWRKDIEYRFWENVEKTEGCWNWKGHTLYGYGRMSTGSRTDGTRSAIQAHRFSYEIHKGPIPDGYQLDHLCGNRRCVNPEHLEAVPPKVNTLRGSGITAQNARKTHCPHGHEYTPENTLVWSDGHRRCRRCRDERYKKWKDNAPNP